MAVGLPSLNARRHILLLNYEYPPLGGGAANATLFMARALGALGQGVVVITSGFQDNLGRREEDGIIVHRLPAGRAALDRGTVGEMCRFIFSAAQHAPRIARSEHCDAAVAFFSIPSGVVARWLQVRCGLPYLVSLRGSDVPGHDLSLNRSHALTRPIRRSVLRHAQAIVANSEGLAETSRAADPFPVRIVANGVDCEVFSPPNQTTAPESGRRLLRLLFVGRVHREKNLGLVLRQLAAAPAAVRDRIELVVAGDGPQQSEMATLATALGLTGRVRWLGWQAKSNLPDLYRSADALVNPSLYEGMPNVVLEAMASGLPVFASDVPGNRAVVVPGQTGVLFPLTEPAQLGSALAQWLADPAWGVTLGRAGRERALADFSWRRAAESYLELLRPCPPPSGRS